MVLWMIYTEISFPHVMNEAQNDTQFSQYDGFPQMLFFLRWLFYFVRWKFRVVAELNFMQIKNEAVR